MTAEHCLSGQTYIMMSPIFTAYVLAFAGVLAKPEQIRAVQDPIYHFYLQSHPKNGKFMTRSHIMGGNTRKARKGHHGPKMNKIS